MRIFLALLAASYNIEDAFRWVDDLFRVCGPREVAVSTRAAIADASVRYGFAVSAPKTAIGQALEFCGILFDSRDMAYPGRHC